MTLIELVVSLGITAVLAVAIGSAMTLTMRAMPSEQTTSIRVADTVAWIDAMVGELQYAQQITEHTDQSIRFTVSDRDGDGSPEVIRYTWPGDNGDEVTRQVNGGAALVVAQGVAGFQLYYSTDTETQTYTGPSSQSAEFLVSQEMSPDDQSKFHIKNDEWTGQWFAPTLPTNAIAWHVTRASVKIRRNGADNQDTLVQLRAAAPDTKLPTLGVLAQEIIDEAPLTTNEAWVEVEFGDIHEFSPGQSAVLVLLHQEPSGESGEVIHTKDGTGQVVTKDKESDWAFKGEGLLHSIYGAATIMGAEQSFSRTYVDTLSVHVELDDPSAFPIDSAVRMLNRPEIVGGHWVLNFDDDPTAVDLDGDGADWTFVSGSFDPDSVTNGIWQIGAEVLRSQFNRYLDRPTTIDLRMRHPIVGTGIITQMRVDGAAGSTSQLRLVLVLDANGSQFLSLTHFTSASTGETLTRVYGLPADFVDIRLEIDPDLDTVRLLVDGVEYGVFAYASYAEANTGDYIQFSGIGAGGEFDRVEVRVAEDVN